LARKILIDTDTASDDAVALIMALVSSNVSVEAITVVAGNVSVQQGTSNALFTVELCGADVPVYIGAAAPLTRKLEMADWFHGQDGLGDHGYAPRKLKAAPMHGVDAILQTVDANPGIEIITLGPLTNLALTLLRRPNLPEQISRCVVMGGAPCCEGNVTPAAEFNFWVDPEAARIVLRSLLPIELVGWQLSRGSAVINQGERDALLALKTPLAEFAVRCNSAGAAAYAQQTGEIGISLPDPTAMAILLDPGVVQNSSAHYMDVQTDDGATRGMSVIDKLGVANDPRNRSVWHEVVTSGRKHQVIWQLDVPGWKRALFRALGDNRS
jgi:inosine-uridine nucleoside N-ribohydrolase